MFGAHCDANTTTDAEGTRDFTPDGINGRDEVVEDLVREVLMEHALLAVTPVIEFQRLGLDDARTWHVADRDLSEVGLARGRAEAGELVRRELDGVVPARIAVREGLQRLLGLVLGVPEVGKPGEVLRLRGHEPQGKQSLPQCPAEKQERGPKGVKPACLGGRVRLPPYHPRVHGI